MGVSWYPGALASIDSNARKALEMTAEAVRTDLLNSQTLPRDTGELTESVYVDRERSGKGQVSIVTNTPYARRLYFHPEFHFRQDRNKRAGGMWYAPYLKGKKLEWAKSAYAKFMRGLV